MDADKRRWHWVSENYRPLAKNTDSPESNEVQEHRRPSAFIRGSSLCRPKNPELSHEESRHDPANQPIGPCSHRLFG